MKSLKFIFINTLTLLIGLAFMTGSFSSRNAYAGPTDIAPKIQVQKLGNFRGHYLTAFYALGTRPFLGTHSSQVTLTELKTAKTAFIGADFVDFPAVELAKQGFQPGYNLLVFVISPEPNYSWVNANGEDVKNMIVTNNHRASLIRSYTKSEIEALLVGQGLESGLVLTLQ
ncbi:MAG: hypothetical protein IPM97_11735 [Bdellovibrionaceae bacterium]|nr:hypothetical protein [Pseudobdellovibrionaceae bacterium]